MRRLVPMSLLVVTACLAAGCSGSSSRAGGQAGSARYAANGTFTLAIPDDRGVFDPYRTNIFGYAGLAYDSLVNLQRDGKFVSGLAERWSTSANSASFTLRSGVTCSDGTPLTASQVAADVTYLGKPENRSPQYGVTIPTVPFTVTADDATRVVKIAMKKPFGFLLNTIGTAPIMCAKGLKNPKMLASASDGTGPFVLTASVPGQSYTFTRRKGYTWGPGGAGTSTPGTPAKVVLRIITNETTAANLLLSGEINLARISGQDRERLIARGLARFEVPQAGSALRFNQLDGRPGADKRVRQALVQALDLGELIKVSTGGTGTAATGLVAMEPKPCTGDTVAGQLPRHDASAAGTLLDQAGWALDGKGRRSKDGKPLTLDVHYVPASSTFNKPTAELIAEQWKAIGAQVKLTADTTATFTEVMYKTKNWDVSTQAGGFNLPSQVTPFLSGPVPPNGTNSAGINNGDYESLVAKAETMVPPASCAYWSQAEKALWREVNPVPISNRPWIYFLKGAQAQASGFDLPIPTSIRVLR